MRDGYLSLLQWLHAVIYSLSDESRLFYCITLACWILPPGCAGALNAKSADRVGRMAQIEREIFVLSIVLVKYQHYPVGGTCVEGISEFDGNI